MKYDDPTPLPTGAARILVRGRHQHRRRKVWAIVDQDDYDRLRRLGRWYIYRESGKTYAECRVRDGSGGLKIHKMHRVVMDAPPNVVVDHIDLDTFNNRKENLRFATLSQNRMNVGKAKGYGKSKYRGVSWDPQKEKWRARLVITAPEVLVKVAPGRKSLVKHGGFFDDEGKAALRWNELALEVYPKEYVRLNVVEQVGTKDGKETA